MARTAHTFGDNLHELLIFKLQSLVDIENEMVKALQKMSKAASDQELKEGLEQHLHETEQQVHRAEKALVTLGAAAKKTKNAGIRGLEEDASFMIKNIKNDAARDAALVASALAVEHFEIAQYDGAIAWARAMNHADVADLLTESLDEEKHAKDALRTIAESGIIERANPLNGPAVD